MSQTTTTVHENTVRVGETDIHYVERGEGKPIVLIHGFAPISTWRVWEANMATLAQDRRVLAVDLPGYGQSSGESPSDFGVWFRTNAEVIHGFLDTLQIEVAAVCGLSAGGGAALTLAKEWPDSVERLVLVDSAGAQAAEAWSVIRIPTLLVWQKEDRIVPLDQGRILAKCLPHSRLEVLEGNASGLDPHDWHWAQALNPEQFNGLVTDFLNEA